MNWLQKIKREKLFKSVVKETMETLGVSRSWAEKRVNNLLSSGLLELFDGPDDFRFRTVVDLYMQVKNDEDLPKLVEWTKAAMKEQGKKTENN